MDPILEFFKRDRFAEMIGVELLEARPGYAKGKVDIRSEHLNGFRAVQGGVIFTLADFVMAGASNADGRLAVAINASINYIKSGYGKVLYAEAKETSSNPKLASYEVLVTNDQGETIATMQGLAYRKKDTLAQIVEKMPD